MGDAIVTPIYASDRAQVQDWYAYPNPKGRYVLWDGGINRSSMATGFWCPLQGTIVDAPDKMIAAMPPTCLSGYLDGEHLTVTGFPHVSDVMPVVNPSNIFKPVRYFYDDPEKRASFMDELLLGPSLIGDAPCELVKVMQLSEDRDTALAELRDMPLDTIARHPWCVWSVKRSVHCVSNTVPDEVYHHCRIREIVSSNQMELVDFVEVWRTVEILDKVIPLYPGDDEIECDFWEVKKSITLYTIGNMVIGYE